MTCPPAGSLAVTMGVKDLMSTRELSSILHIGATHGHGSGVGTPQLSDAALTWTPDKHVRLLGAHGTSNSAWQNIQRTVFMFTNDRTACHFSVCREDVLLKEIWQLKDKGVFIFVNPHELIERGY